MNVADTSLQNPIKKVLIYLILIACSIFVTLPLLFMLSTALKPDAEVWTNPGIPHTFMWSNFVKAFTSVRFGTRTDPVTFLNFFYNTVKITGAVLVGTVLSCTLVAYAFARLKAPGQTVLFLILLSTMMLPADVTRIPIYFIFKELGWVNTHLPLIVPSFFASAFNVFLLRQFFKTLPVELDEAAKIDGATQWQILWKIAIPLSMPAIATVAVFTFNGVWNDFMGPLLYLNKPHLYTLALGINFFKGYGNDVQWNYLMAASLVVMLPSLILFFVGQKYFVEGITLTGMKG